MYPPKTINSIKKNMQLYLASKSPLKYLFRLTKVPVEMGIKTKFKWIMQNKWTYPVSIKDK